jgi:hypothetical protein
MGEITFRAISGALQNTAAQSKGKRGHALSYSRGLYDLHERYLLEARLDIDNDALETEAKRR